MSRTAFRFLLSALLCLMAATAYGQATIVGPVEVVAGEPVWYEFQDVPEGAVAKFFPTSRVTAGPPRIHDGHAMFRALKPGEYEILGMLIKWDEKFFQPISLTVTVIGEGHPPPPPPPPPVPGKLAVVVIEESTERTPSQATTLLALRKHLEKEGIWYRIVDDDLKDSQTGKTPTWLVPYLETAEGKQLPLLAVGSLTSDGHAVVAVEKMPATAREAVEFVEGHR